MSSETRYWAGLALLGVVAACAVLATLPRLTGDFIAVWAACCRLIEMPLAADAAFRNALTARAAAAVLATLSTGLVFRRAWSTRGFLRRLPSASVKALPTSLARLLDEMGLAQHVTVIATEVPLAFCAGWLQPRIYLSTGLIALLQTNELRAVLLHEDYHRQRLDPLRSLLSEALAAAFFSCPWRRNGGPFGLRRRSSQPTTMRRA